MSVAHNPPVCNQSTYHWGAVDWAGDGARTVGVVVCRKVSYSSCPPRVVGREVSGRFGKCLSRNEVLIVRGRQGGERRVRRIDGSVSVDRHWAEQSYSFGWDRSGETSDSRCLTEDGSEGKWNETGAVYCTGDIGNRPPLQ